MMAKQDPGRAQRVGIHVVPISVMLVVLILLTSGCLPKNISPGAANYESDVPVAWFDLALTLIQETEGFTPPVASRALGYLGVTLYETVQPGMPGYHTLVGQLNELKGVPRVEWSAGYHWPTAANAALAEMMRKMFPTASPVNLAAIDALEEQFAQTFIAEVNTPAYRRSVLWGQAVADAVFAWSLTDGGHEGYLRNFPTDYTPPVGPGLWVSTPPGYARALQPTWGENRPFALDGGDTCPAPSPPDYSEATDSAFYAEAIEVYEVGLDRTPEETAIAEFWSDDPGRTSTPPGHWVSILNQVLVHQESNLDVAAEAYAKVGIAVADAFITCWYTKFEYNLVRPITYIQEVIDPGWNTPNLTDPVTTPPFPEYTSGHSVQSGAAATVLTELFGDNFAFVDHTHEARGLPARSYPSFNAAADEAAISRLYGGIHYRSAIELGVAQGRCVGERVLKLRFK